jgi:two-component system chemotaxis response regulator CheY
MRRIIMRNIRQAGFSELSFDFEECDTGKEVLDLIGFALCEPNVVICAWDLSDMTGLDLLLEMNSNGFDIPFGFVVSDSNTDMIEQATEAGADFLLSKPFTSEDFAQILSQYID